MAFIETVLNVFDEDDRSIVVAVGPVLDGGDCVRFFTPSAESKACLGEIDVTVTADFAKVLGAALIRVAEEIEGTAK